ncbi:MAG: hypothetical protein N3G22_03050 [Candidatus Micrarchaeota archaeon]|nr:hypothetical protein [Candidatus Micrarchaeota archaeon]
MERKLAIAALLALLVASAGCTSYGGGGSASFWMWGWGNIVGIAVIIVLLLLSIGYMVAALMEDEKLKAWVKKEMGQVVYSVLIIAFVVALFGVLNWWLRQLSIGSMIADVSWQNYISAGVCCEGSSCVGPMRGRPCHIEAAIDFLQLLYDTSRTTAVSALANYWVYAFLAHTSAGGVLSAIVAQAGLHIKPLAGLSSAADYFLQIFDISVKMMMLHRVQQLLLEILNYPVFPVFLSMGLVLRVLYFTRKLGGMLIALALSFYIVYPMFYVVSYAVLWGFLGGANNFGVYYDSNSFKPPMGENKLDIPESDKAKEVFETTVNYDICNSVVTGRTAAIRQQAAQDQQKYRSVVDVFKGNWEIIAGVDWFTKRKDFFLAGTGGGLSKDGPIGRLATIMVFTLVVPFLALMTTLASVKVFSPLIGGDVEIALLSKLI